MSDFINVTNGVAKATIAAAGSATIHVGKSLLADGIVYASDGVNWDAVTTGDFTTSNLPDPSTLAAGTSVVVDGIAFKVTEGDYVAQRKKVKPFLCAAIGDSRFANSVQNQSTASVRKYNWANQGSLFWLNFLTFQAIEFPIENDLAVSGQTTAQILASVNNVLALSPLPQLCFINGGTNSFGVNPTSQQVADSLSDIKAAAEKLLSFGITPVVEIDTPRTLASWSAAAQKCSISYNNKLRTWAKKRGIRLADHESAYLQISGEPAAGYNVADGIHQSCTGAVVRAYALKAAISDIIESSVIGTSHPLDTYDQTLNSNGNMLTNGLMTGTGGANAGTGASGSVPTAWTSQVVSGTGTAVASKESPRADGLLGDRVQIVLSATAAMTHRLAPTTTLSVPAGVVAGDKIIGELDVEITSLSGVVDYLRLNIFDFDGSTPGSSSVAGKDVFATGLNPLPVVPLPNSSGAGNLATTLKGRLRTSEIIMGQGITSTQIIYRIESGLVAVAAMTYKTGAATLRKI